MLHQHHPHINGVQSVLLSQTFAFSPQRKVFVQILHEHSNHWITVSTIGCSLSTINVYDGLHGTVSMHTQRIIADIIMQSQSESITLQLQDVQWQANGGLFALANATALCNGTDPCEIIYQQQVMRDHFRDCIDRGLYTLALSLQDKTAKKYHKLKSLIFFCLCRQPDYGCNKKSTEVQTLGVYYRSK